MLRSDQAARAFAVTVIIMNTMIEHANEYATLALTILSIVWVGYKLANEIRIRKKLKNNK